MEEEKAELEKSKNDAEKKYNEINEQVIVFTGISSIVNDVFIISLFAVCL